MIDDDFFPRGFPTRTGDPVGTGLENRMIGSVGGPDGIRTKVITLPDGSSVRMKTRAGMPEFIHTKAPQVEDTPRYVWAYSYASVARNAEGVYSSYFFSGDAGFLEQRAIATWLGGSKTLRYDVVNGTLPLMEGRYWLEDVAGGYWYNKVDGKVDKVVTWQKKSYVPTLNSGTFNGAYGDGYYSVALFGGLVRLNHDDAFDVNGDNAGVYARQPTADLYQQVVASITSTVCVVCCACYAERITAESTIGVVRVLLQPVYPASAGNMLVRDYVDGVAISELQVPAGGEHLYAYQNGKTEAVSTAGWSMSGKKVVLKWSIKDNESTVFTILNIADDGASFSTEDVAMGPVSESKSTTMTSNGKTTTESSGGTAKAYNSAMWGVTYLTVNKATGQTTFSREIPPPNTYDYLTTARRDVTFEARTTVVGVTAVGFSESDELCATFTKIKRVANATGWAEEKKHTTWAWSNLITWEKDDAFTHSSIYGYTTSTMITEKITTSSVEAMTDCAVETSLWVGGVELMSRSFNRLFPFTIIPKHSSAVEKKVVTMSPTSGSVTMYDTDYYTRLQEIAYVAATDKISLPYTGVVTSITPWKTAKEIQGDATVSYQSDGYVAYGDYLFTALLACPQQRAYFPSTPDFFDFGSGVILLRDAEMTGGACSSRMTETVKTYTYKGIANGAQTPSNDQFTVTSYPVVEPVAIIEGVGDSPQMHTLLVGFVPVSSRKVQAVPGNTAWCPVRGELLHFYERMDACVDPKYPSALLGALYNGSWRDVTSAENEPVPVARQAYMMMNPTPFGIKP